MSRCATPIPLATLVDYALGDLPAAEEEAVEAHYFECGDCAQALQDVQRLGHAVADVVRAGGITVHGTTALVEHARASGLQVREYHIERGAEVQCTAAPGDAFVAVSLLLGDLPRGPLGVRVVSHDLETGEQTERIETDVLADRATGRIVVLFAGDDIRALRRSRHRFEVLGPNGFVADFRLDHTPWEQRA